MKSARLASALALLLAGCATPVNDATWARYTVEGNAAHAHGNLAFAEEAHRRAAIDARTGKLGPEREAIALHNLGLAKRDLCKLDEALEALSKAYELRDKNPNTPPSYLTGTLFELAQLHYEQRRYAAALALMERGLPVVEKADAAFKDPAGFAHVLLEYAELLRQVNRDADVQAVQARIDALASARELDLQRKPNSAPFNHPHCG